MVKQMSESGQGSMRIPWLFLKFEIISKRGKKRQKERKRAPVYKYEGGEGTKPRSIHLASHSSLGLHGTFYKHLTSSDNSVK